MAVDIQLSKFIETNNILGSKKYGFRPESNALSACFDLINPACTCTAKDKIKKYV